MAGDTFPDGTLKCPNCDARFGECHHLAAMAESDVEPGTGEDAAPQADSADDIPPPALDVAEPFGHQIAVANKPIDIGGANEEADETPITAEAPIDADEAPLDMTDEAPVDLVEEIAPPPPTRAPAVTPVPQGEKARLWRPQRSTEAQARFLKRMQDLGAQRNVVFIGYKTAGKTWLLHRLRQFLFSARNANLRPKFTPVPAGGQSLPGTSDIEFHDIVTKSKWTIVDTPGEFTSALIEGELESLGELVALLSSAKAIVIALPADTLVFGRLIDRTHTMSDAARRQIARDVCGEGAHQDDVEYIDEFIKGLRDDHRDFLSFAGGMYLAASTLSYVRTKPVNPLDEAEFQTVTEDLVVDHCGEDSFQPIGGPDGLTCPVFVALTKADRVVGALHDERQMSKAGDTIARRHKEMRNLLETKALRALAEYGGMLQDFDPRQLSRPSEFVRTLAPELHARLVNFCPMVRFDFVSAFFGHDYNTTTLASGAYTEHPQWGVDHMFEWIRDAIGLSKQSEKRKKRQVLARRIHFAIHGVPDPDAGSLEKKTGSGS